MDFLRAVKTRVETRLSVVALTETTLAILTAVATVLVMVSHLVFLTRYPIVFIDEPWYANAAWNWLQTGVNFDSMHAGTMDQAGYEWMGWPVIGNAPWLLSFGVLGLGLFQARFVSWVFGILLLLMTLIVGHRSYSAMAGALAALLLSLCPPFLQGSHYARPDIMLASIVMMAYFIALVALEGNKKCPHLLAGLLMGLSLDVHENGLMFALGLAAMYLVSYRSKMLRMPGTWLCAVGGLLGIAYWTAIHILPSPSTFFAQNISLESAHKPPLLTLSLSSLLASAHHEVGRYHFYDNGLDFALIGASIVYLAVRRQRVDRLLLAFIGAAFLGFVLFVGNKHDIYAILFYPFFLLMVAEVLVSLVRGGKDLVRQRAFAIGLLVLLLANSVQHYVRPIAAHRDYDYYSITEQIRQVIPGGARVMGPPEWWLGLADYDYVSSLNLTFYYFQDGYSLTKGLETIRPDVLIVDTRWRSLLVDEGYFAHGSGFDFYKLPRQEFEGFLAQQADRVLEFSDPWHGKFEIYAVRWE